MSLSAALLLAAVSLDAVGVDEHLGAPVPTEVVLRDERGAPVRLGDTFVPGRPTVILMVYYRCPMLCGLTARGALAGLAELPFEPGEDYALVSVSIDPDDGPATAAAAEERALREAGRPHWALPWRLLSGEEGSVRRLAAALGFRYAYDPSTEQYAHPAVLFVLTPDGRISRYLYGVDFPGRDLRLALVEAGEGRTGSFLDKVLLTCWRWDPASRRYGPFVAGFVRIGAVIILLATGAVVAGLWLRDRRRSRLA